MSSGEWNFFRTSSLDALRIGGQVGPYTVLGALGAGTTGRVFHVRDPRGRDLALKVLMSSNPASVARFAKEGHVTAHLRHPGIVTVYGAGEIGGYPYLVYEFVQGATLAERLPDLDREARLRVIKETARALGFAHRQGVLHRDVKAENVIVEPSGRARVVDFGLAQVAGSERMTRTGAWIGSPSYMSPEQIAGHRDRFGPPTDVWGLGVLLFYVLSGRVPFDAQNVVELMAQVAGATPPSLKGLDPDYSPALEAVCLRALAKVPASRYADGDAFADALERAMEEPLGPPSRAPARVMWGLAVLAVVGCLAVLSSVSFGGSPEDPPAEETTPSDDEQEVDVDALLADAGAALADEDAAAVIALLEPFVARAQVTPGVVPPDKARSMLATAYALRARAERRERDLAAAGVTLQQGFALDPRNSAVRLERAWFDFAEEGPEEGLRSFARLLEDDPDNASAHFGRGICFFELKSYDAAQLAFERAFQLRNRRRYQLWVGRVRSRLEDHVGAIEIYNKVLERAPLPDASKSETRAQVLLDRARANFALKEVAAAELDCSAALSLEPDDPVALQVRGRCRDQLRRYMEAEADLLRSLELAPDASNYHDELAHHYSRRRDFATMHEVAERGVQAFPTHAHLRFDRGLALYRLGRFPEALADFDYLIEHGQRLARAMQVRLYELRAVIRAYSGPAGVAEDIEVLDRLGKRPQNAMSTLLNQAQALCLLGDAEGALARVDDFLVPKGVLGAQELLEAERVRATLVQGKHALAVEHLQRYRKLSTDTNSAPYVVIQLAALGDSNALEPLKTFDPESWHGRMALCMLGELSSHELLADAQATQGAWVKDFTVPERLCEAHYYIGLRFDGRGDLAAARLHYLASIGANVPTFNETQAALGRLRFLAR